MSEITQRERDIWRAAITLAHNICIQHSDDINSDDGSLEEMRTAEACAQYIVNWIKPDDDSLQEMFIEAGVEHAS